MPSTAHNKKTASSSKAVWSKTVQVKEREWKEDTAGLQFPSSQTIGYAAKADGSCSPVVSKGHHKGSPQFRNRFTTNTMRPRLQGYDSAPGQGTYNPVACSDFFIGNQLGPEEPACEGDWGPPELQLQVSIVPPSLSRAAAFWALGRRHQEDN